MTLGLRQMNKIKQIIVSCLLTLLLVILIGILITLCCFFPKLAVVLGCLFYGSAILGLIAAFGVLIHDILFNS
jgi:hypothetical protein